MNSHDEMKCAIDPRSILAQGFGPLGKVVMKDREISISAKGLYGYIVSHGKSCFPKREVICHYLGISKDTLSKLMNELIARGYVTRTQQRGKGQSFSTNLYIINMIIPTNPAAENDSQPCLDFSDTETSAAAAPPCPKLSGTAHAEDNLPRPNSSNTGISDTAQICENSPCPNFSDTATPDAAGPCPKLPDTEKSVAAISSSSRAVNGFEAVKNSPKTTSNKILLLNHTTTNSDKSVVVSRGETNSGKSTDADETECMSAGDKFGIAKKVVGSFIQMYGVDKVLRQFKNLAKAANRSIIRNPGGWLRTALILSST